MSARLAVILGGEADASAEWLTIDDGRIVDRAGSRGTADAEPAAALLIVPAAATTIHRTSLPALAPRQAAAAARVMALETSIGAADAVHVAVGRRDSDGALDMAVVGSAAMAGWLLWAQQEGIEVAAIVPAGLLLPRPGEGYARGRIGREWVVRGPSSAFVDDGIATLVVGDAPVTTIDAALVDAAIVGAFDAPPLDLRQGLFAPRRRRAIDWPLLRRAAVLAGCILFASLALAIIEIVKLDRDTARLDAASVALARSIDPGVSSAGAAQGAVRARPGAGIGLAAPLAQLFAAVQATPAVRLSGLDWPGGGVLRATLAVPRGQGADPIVASLRAAGYAVSADPPQDQGAESAVAITVRAP